MPNELTHNCHLSEDSSVQETEMVINMGQHLDSIGSNNRDGEALTIMGQGGVHVHIKHGYLGDEELIQNNVIGPRSSSIIVLKCGTTAAQVREIANSARMDNGEAPGVYFLAGGEIDGGIACDQNIVFLQSVSQNITWNRFIDGQFDPGSDNEVFKRSDDRTQLIFNRPIVPLPDIEDYATSESEDLEQGVSLPLEGTVLGTKRSASEAFDLDEQGGNKKSKTNGYSESSGDHLALPTEEFRQPSLERIVSGTKTNPSQASSQNPSNAAGGKQDTKKNKRRSITA